MRTTTRRRQVWSARFLLGALLACTLFVPPARAEEPHDESGSKWQVDFVPYLWISTMKGSTSVGGRSVGVDVGYEELFDLIGDHFSLLAGMGHLEVRHDRIYGFLDVVYATVDTDQAARLKGIDDPQVSTGPIDVAVELDQTSTFFEFGAGYTVLRLPLPARNKPFAVEALAGGRYNYFWTRVRAAGSTTIPGLPSGSQAVSGAVAGGGDIDWVDPFIGGRFMVPITNDIDLQFRGDIGGFGAGSDLAWSIVSGFKYRIPWEPLGVHPWFALTYKVLSFDYEDGAVGIDLTLQGPAVGIGLTF